MKNAVRVASSRYSVLPRAPVGAKFPGREPTTLAGSRTRLQNEKVTFKERRDRLQVELWNVSSEETWTVRFIQPPIFRMRITETRRDGWNGLNQGQGLKRGLSLPHVLCVALIQKTDVKPLLVFASSKADLRETDPCQEPTPSWAKF